jgi:hypothetical protein
MRRLRWVCGWGGRRSSGYGHSGIFGGLHSLRIFLQPVATISVEAKVRLNKGRTSWYLRLLSRRSLRKCCV